MEKVEGFKTLLEVSDKCDRLLYKSAELIEQDCDIAKLSKLISSLKDAIGIKRSLLDSDTDEVSQLVIRFEDGEEYSE